jgi:hypothetical protein
MFLKIHGLRVIDMKWKSLVYICKSMRMIYLHNFTMNATDILYCSPQKTLSDQFNFGSCLFLVSGLLNELPRLWSA